MPTNVFLVRVGKDGRVPPGAIEKVFGAAALDGCISERDMVALKLHFGEPGNRSVWQPAQIREVVKAVKEANGLPFLTDANVLYHSLRHNAVEHLMVAHGNGFSYESCGAPLIIADGLHGDNALRLPIPGGRHYQEAKIASEIARAGAIISLTHVTGHILFGVGGAIKNLAMGSGSSAGKQMMHTSFTAEVDEEKCVSCGVCASNCAFGAITVPAGSRAVVDSSKCVGCGECVAHCPVGAIPVQWGETEGLQERTVEFCAAIMNHLPGKLGFINLATDITGMCDCMRERGENVCANIGVLAGSDPVAVDQATMDLIDETGGLGKIQDACLSAKIGHAQEYAEELGIGSRDYKLVEVSS